MKKTIIPCIIALFVLLTVSCGSKTETVTNQDSVTVSQTDTTNVLVVDSTKVLKLKK